MNLGTAILASAITTAACVTLDACLYEPRLV